MSFELNAERAIAFTDVLAALPQITGSTPTYRASLAMDAGFPCCFGPHCPACRACPQMMAFRPYCSRLCAEAAP